MGNFDDFDLDLKKISESSSFQAAGAAITSAINCTVQISKWLNCTPACPIPTLGEGQKPVASCHKVAEGTIQLRC